MSSVSKFFLVCLSSLAIVGQAVAANQSYSGNVDTITLVNSEDIFLVSLEGDSLADCEGQRVWYSKEKLGEFRFKASFAMALTAKASGEEFAVVTDNTVNGVGGRCYADGQTARIK
ncbi:hypothetical protein [Marinobacter sp. JSM 1782161]|uniref:hypothetical protein n=1 Tax=Marinobacter sp. JSM 1782161 TaxID=2685906 RepID=UPI0014023731|nr:hypothetical protein [Marinobacter sp. JSM 1782161]